MRKILSYLYYIVCRVFFKWYCPINVQGRENLPSRSFILCSNHNSHMDTPILMLATGIPFSQFGMLAARDYFFDNPWRNILVNFLMNLIPIDRNISRTSLENNIAVCKEFIKKKQRHLIIYPEGTRSLTGEIQSFKSGSAKIALELQLPLIPVYIEGAFYALRKGRYFPKRGRIQVKIGKPIEANKDKKQLTELLENSVKKLKDG